jgi:ElaB/YqjD/DUF883 family membrane-anchored ribosome-binding protein
MSMMNTATARAHDTVDQVADQTEALTANGEKLLERASQFDTDHPIQSLGLALAAGYLISRLTR